MGNREILLYNFNRIIELSQPPAYMHPDFNILIVFGITCFFGSRNLDAF